MTSEAQKASSGPRPGPDTLGSGGGILCLGLFRTGTYSMTKALNTLGYPRVLHGMDLRDFKHTEPWAPAAWANMPYIRTHLYPDPARPPPWLVAPVPAGYSRADWDGLFGPFDGATDLASLYAPDLVRAYPDAKVILVERDVDAWAESLDKTVIGTVTGRAGTFVRSVAEPVAGIYNYTQLWDVLRGFFRVKTADDMRATSRDRYREHYRTLRAMVPPAQLLEYKLGDGWEPLCAFLGKPVPDVPFPRVNDGKSLVLLMRIGMAWTVLVAAYQLVKYPALLALLWYGAVRGEALWGYVKSFLPG